MTFILLKQEKSGDDIKSYIWLVTGSQCHVGNSWEFTRVSTGLLANTLLFQINNDIDKEDLNLEQFLKNND